MMRNRPEQPARAPCVAAPRSAGMPCARRWRPPSPKPAPAPALALFQAAVTFAAPAAVRCVPAPQARAAKTRRVAAQLSISRQNCTAQVRNELLQEWREAGVRALHGDLHAPLAPLHLVAVAAALTSLLARYLYSRRLPAAK